jgi:transposase
MEKAPQYTEKFKRNIVTLYRSGKSAAEIIREYGLSQSVLYKWVKKYGEIKISETETITAAEIQKMRQRMARLEEDIHLGLLPIKIWSSVTWDCAQQSLINNVGNLLFP